MSSFWQTSSPQILQKHNKKFNDSLPSLCQTSKMVRGKGSSKTIHQILTSNKSKVNLNKEESLKRKLPQKKQTLVSIYSRSMYRLPAGKNKNQDIPIIEFSQALSKIEDIFNEEFNISQIQFKLKLKKTFAGGKMTCGKLNELQTLLDTNPKKQAKRQFQDIFRVFNRIPPKAAQGSKKKQKDQLFIRMKKHNTFTSTNSNHRSSSDQKSYEQSLTQPQRLEFIKQTKAFQKAQKHLMLKSYTVKMFYHHLNAQLAMQNGFLQEALISLYYCEYYARKIDFDSYIIPCLIMQSEIRQSLYDFQEAIKILKTALQFSVVKRWKQLEMRILEKVSIVYYYRGNSYMAKYYKQISENGLPQNQFDIYAKEYSKDEELRSLEARLFSLPFDGINKKKHNQNYQMDISRDLFQDHEKMINSHHEEVSSMLRSNKTSKIGTKFRKLILQNCEKAEVRKFNHVKHTSEIMPRFVSFEYPIEHCSQILKSHLSKGRFNMNSQIKSVNFIKTLNFMKILYRRLIYELSNEKSLENMCDKENLPFICS